MSSEPDAQRLRSRWLFRGREGAWDAIAHALAADPTRPAEWPIAPTGPSMEIGDAVLLWRSGRGGGIAALCTVTSEPEARPRPGQAPEVVVGLRVERAYAHPIAPATLARHALLRPLAFMDLLDETERRVTERQEEALLALVAERERDAMNDPDEVQLEARTSLPVPVRLLPLVEELLVALGADDPAPAPSAPRRPTSDASPTADRRTAEEQASEPTSLQLAHAETIGRAIGDATFTVDEVAQVWRTGVGTARSRVERLVEAGLMLRAGTLPPDQRPGGASSRGRPPVLYRLTTTHR